MTALLCLALVGAFSVAAVLAVRSFDQRGRDATRTVVRLEFPRGLRTEQLAAVVRLAVGTAPASSGIAGRNSVVFEAFGTSRNVSFQMRLPRAAADNLRIQLRAAIPGIALTEVSNVAAAGLRDAVELRRTLSDHGLATADPAASNRMIVAALAGLTGTDKAIWQVVVSGGVSPRPAAASVWQLLTQGAPEPRTKRTDPGVLSTTLRLGAGATTPKQSGELLGRLRRAAQAVTGPGARLSPRLLPRELVAGRIRSAATPLTAAPTLLTPDELVALLGWPVGDPLIPGVDLGGSPQLPVPGDVPRSGRVLGRSTVDERPVAQPLGGAAEHTIVVGPTGVGKSNMTNGLFVSDANAGRGGALVDPTGNGATAVLGRLSEEALRRVVLIDPTDETRPVPLPLLAPEGRGMPELSADVLIGLLRHQYRDLGPRSTDILSSSLYALARVPGATIMDLLRLWSDATFRASVAGRVAGDPVLSGFFAWFEGLGAAERSFILAAPLNKIRPLLQRRAIRNVLAAPRATFSFAQAIRERLVVIVRLPEGELGSAATTLIGQVVLSRLWAAIQASRSRTFFNVTIDEAPRFLDLPTDLGDVLARSRAYSVGLTLVGQSLSQFPTELRDIALNSARTKIAFGTSHADARRLAAEFGPGVEADYFSGLARYEAIGAVSLGGTVSRPFTFRTDELDPATPGRAREVRRASRERFGIGRDEIEAAILRATEGPGEPTGKVGRRRT